jgi:hypothetical protein
MKLFGRILLLGATLLAGCRATRDVAATSYHVTRGAAVGSYRVARGVAVGSYRVASAPVHYAMRRGGDESSTTATAAAVPSDVTQPGQSIPPPETASSVSQRQPRVESERPASQLSGASPRTTRSEAAQSSMRTSSSHASAPPADFPTAKSVPGKPGYVVSPFDASGRYVDISGYPPGTKVKDPWTDKIFLVP